MMTTTGSTVCLPLQVTDVEPELLSGFPHSKRVGCYMLGRTIGKGSFAKVKEALHTLTGEKVAVKVVSKKKANEDAYVTRNLRREGKLLQLARHPNIIQIYEVMETENSYYLVTDMCTGGNMMDYICKNKKLEEQEVRHFIRQMISAVDHLHRHGIIHRDLKVENLLLDENRDIKIIDFGLSNTLKVSTGEDGQTIVQEFCITQCGSPAYAAPELLGHRKYGTKVDVWSIGVNMYAMLTGNLPFTVSPFNIKTLHAKMVNKEMNAIPHHLSQSGRALLLKLLTPEPAERISLSDAMRHKWINETFNQPLKAAPFPNKVKTEDLNFSVIKHMDENMSFDVKEVVSHVVNNQANSGALAVYTLLVRRLQRYRNSHKSEASQVSNQSVGASPSRYNKCMAPIVTTKQSTTVLSGEQKAASPESILQTRDDPHQDDNPRPNEEEKAPPETSTAEVKGGHGDMEVAAMPVGGNTGMGDVTMADGDGDTGIGDTLKKADNGNKAQDELSTGASTCDYPIPVTKPANAIKVPPSSIADDRTKKAMEKLNILVYGKEKEYSTKRSASSMPKGNTIIQNTSLRRELKPGSDLLDNKILTNLKGKDNGYSGKDNNETSVNKLASVGLPWRRKLKPSILTNNVNSRVYLSRTNGLEVGYLTNHLKNFYNRQQQKRKSRTLARNFNISTDKGCKVTDNHKLPMMVGVNANMVAKQVITRIDTKRDKSAVDRLEMTAALRNGTNIFLQSNDQTHDKVAKMPPWRATREKTGKSTIKNKLQELVDMTHKGPDTGKLSGTSDSNIQAVILPIIK
ncbi:PREDICTED: MAP/microtubule affinity-regulating kinase 4-like isoform X2 [Priapulus caudatus]|uniref:MAP/microtubule affinity-regulating kinase 4-like isoform X2 n=1 Tax=Priapulus caudatus TaxID=37621 RepID=A0ABM1F9E4_PRICU|nr:PREDICTED: MAP/microtubule affinity-regulating kinase 4-like isoform X2 [Priapulus caudatus]